MILQWSFFYDVEAKFDHVFKTINQEPVEQIGIRLDLLFQ